MPSLADAYTILGLSQGCSREEAKSRYKQVALRTHPDKNPDNPNATVEFQRVSEAYRVISTHLDSDEDEDDLWDCEYDSDDDDDDLDFYMFLFRRAMGGWGPRYRSFPHRYATEKPESREEYQERLRQNTEQRREEEARRKMEEEVRKKFERQQREKECQEAEERQKNKKAAKKAQAKVKSKKAEQTAQVVQERAQARRSVVFQAAREGDVAKVKEGIYESSVDASGGEVRLGCEKYVKVLPKDSQETLLHIATKNGDASLVEYLDRHSAEPDERNSEGLTPVHVALKAGNVNIVTYFFEAYPPEDPDHQAIYKAPEGQNLLAFALQSHSSRAADLVLSNGLASAEDIKLAWSWATSDAPTGDVKDGTSTKELENILALLRRYGGATSCSATQSTCSDTESAGGSDRSGCEGKGRPYTGQREPEIGRDSPDRAGKTNHRGRSRSCGYERGRNRGRGGGGSRGRYFRGRGLR